MFERYSTLESGINSQDDSLCYYLNHKENVGDFQRNQINDFGGLQENRNLGGLRILSPLPINTWRSLPESVM
jgi:hypothetical protein